MTVAVRRDGTIPAIRSTVWVDQGAHALGPIGAGLEPMTTGQSIVGPYRIAHYDCEAYGLLTNKCPQGPYRGVGTVQGIFIIERLMDMVADRLGLDPVEIRRRNLIQSHEFPYATPAGRLYDSGDYLGALERCCAWPIMTNGAVSRRRHGPQPVSGYWRGLFCRAYQYGHAGLSQTRCHGYDRV